MKNNSSRYIFFVIVWIFTWWLSIRFIRPAEPPKPPSPVAVTQMRQEAEKLIQVARKSDATLTVRDREEKYRQGLRELDKIAQIQPKSDLAVDVRLEKAALLEEMAQSNPHYLDEATTLYKTLEKEYAHREATVTLQGKPRSINVSEYANRKLEAVLLQRDQVAHGHFLYRVIDALVALTGRIRGFSYWFALLLLTLIVKGILYPFTKRQYKSMQDMQRIAPLIKEAQEKLKGRPAAEIQQRMSAIYRENNVNMAAGCLPMFVQLFALWPLFYMIRDYEYAFRNGTFLWIGSSLSHQYHQFLGTSLGKFDLPLFLLYLLSMFVTSKMAPPPADPQQAQQQKMMMYMMPVMFGWWMYTAQLPAAFTFYWLVLNVVSTAQQYSILKQHPAPAIAPPAAGASGSGGSAAPGAGPQSGGGSAGQSGGGRTSAGPRGGSSNGRNGRDGKGSSTPGLDARARARRKSKR